MDGETAAEVNAALRVSTQTRQRSSVAFPYMDLKAAVEMAQAIHDNVGRGECEDDQLAAWTGQSAKSSTFRVQYYAGRTFGILEAGDAKHRLSELGCAVVDPDQAREAKSKAFLSVPLYRALFENHKGGTIPPAAALEREIVSLGVSEKQKDRARQVFERSAEQAGFFEHGRNRLVMPGVAQREEGHRREHFSDEQREKPSTNVGGGVGSGSGGGGHPDPLIAALIQKLPKQGPWSTDDRVMWLQMVAMAFQMAYGQEPAIEIKKGA